MAPKKSVTEDVFNAFKAEVERNSRYLVDQLLQEINKLKEKCSNMEEENTRKIGEIEENYERKIELIELELNEVKIKYDHVNRQPVHNYKPEPTHSTEISRPTFYGNNRDVHPKDFLYRLEEYFAIKQSYVGEKLIIVGDCLKAAASSWFSTIRFQLTNYDDFKKAFIDEFWSREIQIQVWSQCLSTKHIPSNTNYREHFATWATKLRHLEVPRLSEHEIVKHIARHYPGYLRAILVSLSDCNILTAMKVLGEEGQEEQTTENKSNQQKTNQNDSNNNNQNGQTNSGWNNTRSSGWSNPTPRNNRWNNQPYRNNDRRGETQQSNQQQTEKINQVSTDKEEQAGPRDNEQHAINSLNTTNQSISPYIQCTIEGEEVKLLVDTGATVSVLTKEVVDIITQRNPKIPQLPVTGIQISNAVGKKICKVSKQIFCECKIGEVYLQTNFIQVENLNEKGIIGADILKKYSAQIKFSEQTVQFKIGKLAHTIPFASQKPRLINSKEHLLSIEAKENLEDNQIALTKDEQEIFVSLLNKYEGIFSDQPGKVEEFQCQIRVKPGDPIYQRQYPIPIARIPKVDAEIQRMVKLGIIEKSTSPWSSPIVCTEKKNGDIRLCLDARKINTVIIPDRECPTNMEETLMKFQGMKYLSSIDLTAGYWQCPLRKDCREITAFLHKGRNYQFKVLPFGLINSVAEFQKILDQVLGPEILQFAAIYVDDIHITSKSFNEHMQHLERIFQKLSQHHITINRKKSQFLKSQIVFLGHIISEKGISMDPDKIQVIKNFQPPKTKKQIQSFLGFINFYRKFIRDLSQDTEQLSALVKKDTKWIWGTAQQQAFENIKEKFLEDIIIQFPDFTREFYINTDASTTHVGAELYQIKEDGRHQSLGFASRTLNSAERNYNTTELELLAIVFACKKFRHYLLGHQVKVLTDHHALTFLNTCQLLNSRLVRWSTFLQEYQLEIIHIPGRENIGADMLTRYPQSPTEEPQASTRNIIINKLTLLNYSSELRKQFKELPALQQADEHIQKLKLRMNGRTENNLIVYNQLLFRKSNSGEYQIIVPRELIKPLVIETHQIYGHCGTYKTYQLLQQHHQFQSMYHTIKRIIKTCDLCQRTKVNNVTARGPTLNLIPEKPMEMVSADLMGPLPRGQGGCQYILAILDIFSKYIKLYPLKRATTDTIVRRIVNDYIPTMGLFQKILTDNGTQFTSKKWIRKMEELKIKSIHTTAYHPESNPVERANREIGRLLRTYCHKQHTNWLRWLDNVEFWINNTTHTTTGYSPQYIMFGENIPLSITQLVTFPKYEPTNSVPDIIQIVMKKTQRKSKLRSEYKDRDKKFPKYAVGMKVLVKEHRLSSAEDHETHKLFLLYHGPYQICEVHDNNTVTVRDQSGHLRTYNFKNIKQYHEGDQPIQLNSSCEQ